MKVWLDDERPMPDGYDIHVRTAAEAIDLLKTGEVVKISLDNDLGPPEAGQGRDVARWIEQAAHENSLRLVDCLTHTQNSVARKEISLALDNAYKYWADHEQYNWAIFRMCEGSIPIPDIDPVPELSQSTSLVVDYLKASYGRGAGGGDVQD